MAPGTSIGAAHPVGGQGEDIEGTIRDHATRARRPFLRFFACSEDWSHDPLDKPLPEEVASGREPLLVVGAIAGG